MRTLGLDEAGRGCVLGPLVVGAFVAEDLDDETLISAGAADSKALTAKKRKAARAALSPLGQWKAHLISATDIDSGNLNTLEEDAILHLVKTYCPDRVIVDALGHPSTIPKIVQRLQARLGSAHQHIHWTMEPKADHTYPVVGAASIFAKTERDQIIENLKDKYGDFGSGYPSDPKTKKWLNEWNSLQKPWPDFVRTRWGTIRALAQQSLIPSNGHQKLEDE